MNWILRAALLMVLVSTGPVWGGALTSSPEKHEANTTLDIEKEKLTIERLKLENENLKLQMEKLKLQAAATPATAPALLGKTEEDKKNYMEAQSLEFSKRAEELALSRKNDETTLVFDFVNSEVWNAGIRYGIHEIYNLMKEQKWKVIKSLEQRSPDGDPRNLYNFRNVEMLKYDTRKRGILSVNSPENRGDLVLLTPQGVSFSSKVGEVRNAFQDAYFNFDGQEQRGLLKVLKYKHGKGFLGFDEKLEFTFDKAEKLINIRYGVLDEK